ncbi:MAG: class I SAM-dependent methyltransferase [Bacteroidetes bacterium]|nr:class I SAM-dependent methyltransferase [Bacteroidota bacterium]
MNDFETTNCLICESKEYFLYTKRGQFGIETNVGICKDCGFSFLNPRWTKKRYHHFYSQEYDTYYRPQVLASNHLDSKYSTVKTIIDRTPGWFDLKKPHISILDIGAGMGDSLIYLKEKINSQAQYYAIESSQHCIENIKRNGINVITNDVDGDWQIHNKEKFDFIVMRHVLEHFLNPADVLKKVREVLKPNGVLYIAVPNSKKPMKPLLAYYFRVVHVSYFSVISLKNLFSITGFKNLQMIEGDESDKNELFSFCIKADAKPFIADNMEWIQQKNIYDTCKKNEWYHAVKHYVTHVLLPYFKRWAA